MSNYRCVQVEYSPVFKDKQAQIKSCVDKMQSAGYQMQMSTEIALDKMLLVFCK